MEFWLREATAAFEGVLRREAEEGRPAARERLRVLRDSYLGLREAKLDRPLAELGGARDEIRGVRGGSVGAAPVADCGLRIADWSTKTGSSQSEISNPQSAMESGDRQVARTKGAWVLWMLRQALGPLSYRAIWADPGGSPDTTEALKKAVVSGEREGQAEDRTPDTEHLTRWDGFFDFWVYSTGLPQYRLLSATAKGAPGAYTVTLKVANRGSGTIPAPLVVQTEEGARHEFSLSVPGGGVSEVTYSMVTKPVAAAVDPEGDLLQPQPPGDWQVVKIRRWF
jgi:hypothetical protein